MFIWSKGFAGGLSMGRNDEFGDRPALNCGGCGILSTLRFDPEPAGYVDQLPDPFFWQCRICGYKQFYAKADIKMMTPDQFAKPLKWRRD